ncbi:MAG TPA: hypothetical protein VGN64_03195 [Dyadobacter sp.]|nr:hypothetical protein [Dyadobacter sp.]
MTLTIEIDLQFDGYAPNKLSISSSVAVSIRVESATTIDFPLLRRQIDKSNLNAIPFASLLLTDLLLSDINIFHSATGTFPREYYNRVLHFLTFTRIF